MILAPGKRKWPVVLSALVGTLLAAALSRAHLLWLESPLLSLAVSPGMFVSEFVQQLWRKSVAAYWLGANSDPVAIVVNGVLYGTLLFWMIAQTSRPATRDLRSELWKSIPLRLGVIVIVLTTLMVIALTQNGAAQGPETILAREAIRYMLTAVFYVACLIVSCALIVMLLASGLSHRNR